MYFFFPLLSAPLSSTRAVPECYFRPSMVDVAVSSLTLGFFNSALDSLLPLSELGPLRTFFVVDFVY